MTALLGAGSMYSAVAEDTATALQAEKPHAHARALLIGTDENGDGIRDDLAAATKATPSPVSHPIASSKVQAELATALANSAPAASTSTRSGCLDYLLLDAKDQARADRYVQARTHGAYGTHPCDPVVSPLLDRPFETDVARLELGPVQLNYAKRD
jgi:hypothetical protein